MSLHELQLRLEESTDRVLAAVIAGDGKALDRATAERQQVLDALQREAGRQGETAQRACARAVDEHTAYAITGLRRVQAEIRETLESARDAGDAARAYGGPQPVASALDLDG